MFTLIALALTGCVPHHPTSTGLEEVASPSAVAAYNRLYTSAKGSEGTEAFGPLLATLEGMPCPDGTDCSGDVTRLKKEDAAKRAAAPTPAPSTKPAPVAQAPVPQAMVVDSHVDEFAAATYKPSWMRNGVHLMQLSGDKHSQMVVVMKGGLPLAPVDAMGVPPARILVDLDGDCQPEGPYPAVDARMVPEMWIPAKGTGDAFVVYLLSWDGESLMTSGGPYPIFEVDQAEKHQGISGGGIADRAAAHGSHTLNFGNSRC